MHPLELVDKQYIVSLKGKMHPTYPGVLQAAMKAGLVELTSKVVQFPSPENGGVAVVEAMAVFAGPDGRDRVFQEVGDCDDRNCTPHIAPHKIRMASTRARGRCLRDALGLGIALAEEMTDAYSQDAPKQEYPITTPKAQGQRPAPQVEQPRTGDDGRVPAVEPARIAASAAVRPPQADPPAAPAPCSTCGRECSKGQIALSWRSYGQVFCPVHQRENNLANRDPVNQSIVAQSPNAAAIAVHN